MHIVHCCGCHSCLLYTDKQWSTSLIRWDQLSWGCSQLRETFSHRLPSELKSPTRWEWHKPQVYTQLNVETISWLTSRSCWVTFILQAKNDDLILLSSINLHQRVDHAHQSEPHLPTDEAHSVVLLTDDRNLRVKAHASHLPVKDVNSFISLLDQKWSTDLLTYLPHLWLLISFYSHRNLFFSFYNTQFCLHIFNNYCNN